MSAKRPKPIVGDPNDDIFWSQLKTSLDEWKEASRSRGMFHDWIDLWATPEDGISRRIGVLTVAVSDDFREVYYDFNSGGVLDLDSCERAIGLFQRAATAVRSKTTDV